MIRVIKEIQFYDGKRYVEIECTSGDTKPTTGIATGSYCHEVDTGAVSCFEEGIADWITQFTFPVQSEA